MKKRITHKGYTIQILPSKNPAAFLREVNFLSRLAVSNMDNLIDIDFAVPLETVNLDELITFEVYSLAKGDTLELSIEPVIDGNIGKEIGYAVLAEEEALEYTGASKLTPEVFEKVMLRVEDDITMLNFFTAKDIFDSKIISPDGDVVYKQEAMPGYEYAREEGIGNIELLLSAQNTLVM